jgi:hypothetical protein
MMDINQIIEWLEEAQEIDALRDIEEANGYEF